jgi:hypothetical protein
MCSEEAATFSMDPPGQLQLSKSKNSEKASSFTHPGAMVDLASFMTVPACSSSIFPAVFSTSSLLLMPVYGVEIFKMLPQKNLHFLRVLNNCPPEFREGQALGLKISDANMAESIKNMTIQDDPQLYEEKMSCLLDLEDDGFEVGALKFVSISYFA